MFELAFIFCRQWVATMLRHLDKSDPLEPLDLILGTDPHRKKNKNGWSSKTIL